MVCVGDKERERESIQIKYVAVYINESVPYYLFVFSCVLLTHTNLTYNFLYKLAVIYCISLLGTVVREWYEVVFEIYVQK